MSASDSQKHPYRSWKKKRNALIGVAAIATLIVSICGCSSPSTVGPSPTPLSTVGPSPTPLSTVASSPTPQLARDYGGVQPVTTKRNDSVDFSIYYDKWWEGSTFTVVKPFTKSVNARGNNVYTGVVKNMVVSGNPNLVIVHEHTNSENETKQLYDEAVADARAEGFVYRSNEVARLKSGTTSDFGGLWAGSLGNHWFYVMYTLGATVSSGWELITETQL